MEYEFICQNEVCEQQIFIEFFKVLQVEPAKAKCPLCNSDGKLIMSLSRPAHLKEYPGRPWGTTWPGKETRLYGVQGDNVGHAEQVRKNKQDKQDSESKEIKHYTTQ